MLSLFPVTFSSTQTRHSSFYFHCMSWAWNLFHSFARIRTGTQSWGRKRGQREKESRVAGWDASTIFHSSCVYISRRCISLFISHASFLPVSSILPVWRRLFFPFNCHIAPGKKRCKVKKKKCPRKQQIQSVAGEKRNWRIKYNRQYNLLCFFDATSASTDKKQKSSWKMNYTSRNGKHKEVQIQRASGLLLNGEL